MFLTKVMLIAAVAVILVAVWQLLTSEQRLKKTLREGFHENVHPEFNLSVEKAHLSPTLRFTMNDGTLRAQDEDRPLLIWDKAIARLNPILFAKGRIVPACVTVDRPTIRLRYRPAKQLWNLEEFLVGIDPDKPRFRELLRDGVHVENATVDVLSDEIFNDTNPRIIRGIQMSVRRRAFYPSVWDFAGRIGEGPLTDIRIEGTYDSGGLNLRVNAENLNVDSEFLNWIPAGKNLERIFRPRGAVSGDLALSVDSEFDASWRGRINIGNMQAKNRFYPLEIQDLSGMVEIIDRKTYFRNVKGLIKIEDDGAGQTIPVEISGSTDMEKRETLVNIMAAGLPLNEKTIENIPEAGKELWERLRPSGTADIKLSTRNKINGADTDFSASVNLRDVTISPNEIPFPIENIYGDLFIDGDGVRLSGITGTVSRRDRPARISINGSFDMQGGLRELHVEFNDLHVDRELLAEIPGNIKALTDLNPSGRIDGEFFVRDDGSEISCNVNLKSGRVETEFFPLPLEELSGTIRLADNVLTLESLAGTVRHRPTGDRDCAVRTGQFKIGGRYDLGREQGEFRVNVEDIDIDRDIVLSIPVAGEELWENHRPQGVISIDGTIEYCGEKETDKFSYHLNTDLKNVSVRWGANNADDLSLVLSGLHGRMLVTNDLIHAPDLTGTIGGGKVDLRGIVSGLTENEDLRYEADIGFNRVDIRKLLREVTGRELNVRGRLSGVLEIAGRNGNDRVLEGQGELSFTQGHIWNAPVFMGLIEVLHLSRPGELGDFDRGEAQYTIHDDYLYVQHFELRSPSAELTGSGKVRLQDGALDARMVAATIPEGGIPILSPAIKTILGPVQRELVRVNVTGTVAEPRYSHSVIGRLTRPVQTLYDIFMSPLRITDDDEEGDG